MFQFVRWWYISHAWSTPSFSVKGWEVNLQMKPFNYLLHTKNTAFNNLWGRVDTVDTVDTVMLEVVKLWIWRKPVGYTTAVLCTVTVSLEVRRHYATRSKPSVWVQNVAAVHAVSCPFADPSAHINRLKFGCKAEICGRTERQIDSWQTEGAVVGSQNTRKRLLLSPH
jgi:hypothetical protein